MDPGSFRERPRGARGGRPGLAAAAVVAMLAASAGAAGEDGPGGTAAPLEGKAAECRYIGRLCTALEARDRELAAAKRAVGADDSAENVEAYRDAFVAAEAAAIGLAKAASEIRKKHDGVLACFCDCEELVRMARGDVCRSR